MRHVQHCIYHIRKEVFRNEESDILGNAGSSLNIKDEEKKSEKQAAVK